jgi:hypothetical protein
MGASRVGLTPGGSSLGGPTAPMGAAPLPSPAAPQSWQQRHTGVQFDPGGQPIEPKYDPRSQGITDFGQAWVNAGRFFQTPQYQAWLKAFSDPSRPATLGDIQGGGSSFYQQGP